MRRTCHSTPSPAKRDRKLLGGTSRASAMPTLLPSWGGTGSLHTGSQGALAGTTDTWAKMVTDLPPKRTFSMQKLLAHLSVVCLTTYNVSVYNADLAMVMWCRREPLVRRPRSWENLLSSFKALTASPPSIFGNCVELIIGWGVLLCPKDITKSREGCGCFWAIFGGCRGKFQEISGNIQEELSRITKRSEFQVFQHQERQTYTEPRSTLPWALPLIFCEGLIITQRYRHNLLEFFWFAAKQVWRVCVCTRPDIS